MDYICCTAGSIDPPAGLALAAHIYTADKGDYHPIADTLPQWPRGSGAKGL